MEMLLTVEQAATRLQVQPETIRQRLRRGLLRGVKSGKLWRVPESALLENSPQPANQWEQAANRLSSVYAESLANDGELTAFSTAPSDFYEAKIGS